MKIISAIDRNDQSAGWGIISYDVGIITVDVGIIVVVQEGGIILAINTGDRNNCSIGVIIVVQVGG